LVNDRNKLLFIAEFDDGPAEKPGDDAANHRVTRTIPN
jgi:hypothetical protein